MSSFVLYIFHREVKMKIFYYGFPFVPIVTLIAYDHYNFWIIYISTIFLGLFLNFIQDYVDKKISYGQPNRLSSSRLFGPNDKKIKYQAAFIPLINVLTIWVQISLAVMHHYDMMRIRKEGLERKNKHSKKLNK